MFAVEHQHWSCADEAFELVGLAEQILAARSLGELAELALPSIAEFTNSRFVLFYVSDPRLAAPHFFHHGIELRKASEMRNLCARQLHRVAATDLCLEPTLPFMTRKRLPGPVFFPLHDGSTCTGMLGIMPKGSPPSSLSDHWARVLRLLACAIDRLVEELRLKRRLASLNTYMNVSSMLPRFPDLRELLETSLYCCMEVTSAEAASILLLDHEKKNLQFYQVEGPAKPLLTTLTFPADMGIAGSVLHSLKSEIVNDVQHDPRFCTTFDSLSRFRTRNMLVAPLRQAREKIGVIEILNKTDGAEFTGEELNLLLTIAEEISFGIRNTMVLECLMSTYCKQRQGQYSCKGCQRPLGSWTPCAKDKGIEMPAREAGNPAFEARERADVQ